MKASIEEIFANPDYSKIFEKEYGLDSNKSVIVENYYGKKIHWPHSLSLGQ
jgi:hypothetical protein